MYEAIVKQIDKEITDLQLVRTILAPKEDVTQKKPVTRVISPEGRANIAAGQARRWAKKKRSA